MAVAEITDGERFGSFRTGPMAVCNARNEYTSERFTGAHMLLWIAAAVIAAQLTGNETSATIPADQGSITLHLDRATGRWPLISAWQTRSYDTPQHDGVIRSMYQATFDCTERRTRLEYYVAYRADGAPLETAQRPPTSQQWSPVVPGSTGEVVWAAVCTWGHGRATNPN